MPSFAWHCRPSLSVITHYPYEFFMKVHLLIWGTRRVKMSIRSKTAIFETRLKTFSALKRECYALLDLSSPVTDILSYDLFGWSITFFSKLHFCTEITFTTKITFLGQNYFFEPKLLFWTEITFLNQTYFYDKNYFFGPKLFFWM